MSPRSKASTRLARVGAIPPSDGATPPSPEAQDEILARIPAAERATIMEHAEEVLYRLRYDMFEQGDSIERVYFPLTGMASLVIVLKDGTTIEALAVGRE